MPVEPLAEALHRLQEAGGAEREARLVVIRGRFQLLFRDRRRGRKPPAIQLRLHRFDEGRCRLRRARQQPQGERRRGKAAENPVQRTVRQDSS